MEDTKIALDTNFLLVPYKYTIDIFEQMRYLIEGKIIFVISKGILNELNSISKIKGKTGLSARFALKLIEKNKENILIIPSAGKVDEWLYLYAKENNAIVGTEDLRLKSRLRREKIRMIVIKSKSIVDFE